MAYLVTRESLRSAGACYSNRRIEEVVPPEGLTPRQVSELHIPTADRVWALSYAAGAPDKLLRLVAIGGAKRALERAEDRDPLKKEALAIAERYANGEVGEVERIEGARLAFDASMPHDDNELGVAAWHAVRCCLYERASRCAFEVPCVAMDAAFTEEMLAELLSCLEAGE